MHECFAHYADMMNRQKQKNTCGEKTGVRCYNACIAVKKER